MSLSSRLEDAVQALATWLLETPVVSQTVQLRIEGLARAHNAKRAAEGRAD